MGQDRRFLDELSRHENAAELDKLIEGWSWHKTQVLPASYCRMSVWLPARC